VSPLDISEIALFEGRCDAFAGVCQDVGQHAPPAMPRSRAKFVVEPWHAGEPSLQRCEDIRQHRLGAGCRVSSVKERGLEADSRWTGAGLREPVKVQALVYDCSTRGLNGPAMRDTDLDDLWRSGQETRQPEGRPAPGSGIRPGSQERRMNPSAVTDWPGEHGEHTRVQPLP
jgi:hypothetical protein